MGTKRILVTGATQGLGRAIARLLDGLGHHTLLTGRNQTQLSDLQKELAHAQILSADLAHLDSVPNIVDHAISALGGLDGLINNAGTIDPICPLAEADPQAWIRAVEVNLTAPALLMKMALPELIKNGGRLVNISTGAAIKPMPGWAAYCASKAGLLHLTSVVAVEAPEVACFSLRPGVIDTAMQETIRESAGMKAPDHQRFLDLHKQGGLLPPEVPGRAAVWLVLEGPKERTGELIDITDSQLTAGVQSLFGQPAT